MPHVFPSNEAARRFVEDITRALRQHLAAAQEA